jgi:GT2 family glycosyltransferase
MDAGAAAVTALIPTIGRPQLLRACLESILACTPPPAEVIVVDQSGGDDTRAVVADFAERGARTVACPPTGPAQSINLGLALARHPILLVTNDDCTVREDWVQVAVQRMGQRPDGIVTGRVLPGHEDTDAVPSVKVDPVPHDYTGEVVINALFGGNMALPRDEARQIGGFDERPGMRLAAEDNDFCYRWLRDGRSLRYEPEMVVWHHDWRSPAELAARYVEYARGDGALYAKYLLRGHGLMLRLAAREISWGLRGLAGRLRRGRPAWQDPRQAILRGLPVGFLIGVRDELRWRWRCRRQARPAR